LNGILIGFFGAILLSIGEYFIFGFDTRKWSFIPLVLVKTAVYFIMFALLIITVICFTRSWENGMGFWQYFNSPLFQTFIYEGDFRVILVYCLIVLFAINFTRQINRKIGHGVLIRYILGKYHRPKEEERIFAFFDIKQSTHIAEKLSPIQFHKLLYEFFNDISLCILITGGEIYRYVGDEIVVTWRMKDGIRDANCIRMFFYAKQQLEELGEKYQRLFGFRPDFHAAYHCGRVIRGELGDIKSQFVYHGETLFLGHKMEKACSYLNCDLVISSALMEELRLPEEFEPRPIGNLHNFHKVQLFTIREKQPVIA
jgi:adenylate cyclase